LLSHHHQCFPLHRPQRRCLFDVGEETPGPIEPETPKPIEPVAFGAGTASGTLYRTNHPVPIPVRTY
jgi:hypothetical protein